MQYYHKIEAYCTGSMQELERRIFEQELAENARLQAELEAYKTTQSLFDFTAKHLPDEAVLRLDAEDTFHTLINFAANQLSETDLLETVDLAPEKTSELHPIRKNNYRITWLVAASLLFLLTWRGISYLEIKDSNSNEPPQLAEIETQPAFETPASIVQTEELEPKYSKAKNESPILPAAKTYKPAKVKTYSKKKMTKERPTESSEPQELVAASTKAPSKKLAINLNTKADKISTNATIEQEEIVTFEVKESLTLNAGFHAKAGSTFSAKSIRENVVSTDQVITAPTKLEGDKIVLKPGFHAKAGTEFVIKPTVTQEEMSSNAVLAANASLELSAQTITLKPGFHAKAGANFTAKVK